MIVAVLSVPVAAPHAQAQSDTDYLAQKKQAIELYKENKFVDALPLLEKLHGDQPGDIVVLEYLSFVTLAHAATLKDAGDQKKERARARKLAEEAKAAGDNSNLLKVVLDVPEDGGEIAYSNNAEVENIMKDSEASFARGDFEAAIDGYTRALALDPKQYTAALFMGDVYFKKKDYEPAGKWFLRAIEIDPNRETAYRYWGDALAAQGKLSEARENFISAIVADPYSRISWVGLSQWAQANKMILGNPRVDFKGQVEDRGKDDKGQSQTNITIDSSILKSNGKKDGLSAWLFYGIVRAPWHGEKFQKEFPGEKQYRHSLPEEAEALQLVVEQVKESIKKKEIKQLDPSLATLVKLSDQGLLEAYILISRPDAGISQDYAVFRNAHREKIHQYISEWIIHPAR